MDQLTEFETDIIPAGQSSIQQKRSHSPVLSHVSYHSMDQPPRLPEGDPDSQSSIQQKRSHSPVLSHVSYHSMDQPPRLPEGDPDSQSSIHDASKNHTADLDDAAASSYQPGSTHDEMQQTHKSQLKETSQWLIEGIPQQGDTRLLHEIYTELYITEGGTGEVNYEHEVRQIERTSWREYKEQSTPISCNDIFKPLLGEDKPIRTVLTKGVAGIGKTVSVQKFILDWAEGKANQDVHFIFSLPFRELNLMKEKKLSLVGLIQQFFPEIKDPSVLNNSVYRVMFIFDGLDECRLPLHFPHDTKCCKVTEPASVDVLLSNLIKGNLLPSALLWITTRPAAANQIPPKCVSQVTEIRGFNDPQKEEYFRKRISDENLASRTITHLKSSRSLYIMCHIPVFCWISATVVEKTSKQSEKVKMPRTLTQMYTHFLIIQTSITKGKYTERDEDVIFRLGKLAFQQLEKGNLIFYEEDLRECGIDVTEASVYSGVCTQIFREEPGLSQRKVFSFVHLSIQEFLAALYVFLCFSNRQRNMPDQQQTSQPSALFTAATLHDLHKTAVNLALQSKNGHLDLFLRFLLGLSLESNQNLLQHLLLQTSSQSGSSEQTVACVKQKIRDQISLDRRINLFYCLNELNHHAVVEVIDRSSGTLYVAMLLPGEWESRRFKFKMSQEQLDEFKLQKYIKTPETDQTELLDPDEVLQRLLPVVTTSTSAWLVKCKLTEKSCSYLTPALTSQSSSLRMLGLDENPLDSGMELLCSALCHENCKLEKLELYNCNLTEKSCSYLNRALTAHSSCLKKLDLSWNELLDSGVKDICSALKHQNCKLELLQINKCYMTEESCSYLASVLTSNSSSLRVLLMSHNELLDSGVEHLCSGLRHQNCKLEKLWLNDCKLTEKSCSYLASALTSHSSNLKHLGLRDNNLTASDAEQLCALVEDPHCKLEKLELNDQDIKPSDAKQLSDLVKDPYENLEVLNL